MASRYTPRGGPYTSASASAQNAPRATFEWDSVAKAYKVDTPFDSNFVEFIKAKIPGQHRAPQYDPQTKKFAFWFIAEQFVEPLVELARLIWPAQGAVRFVSRSEVEAQQVERERLEREQREAHKQAIIQALPERERAMVSFLSLLSLDALKAAYRKAALELHPDRGGDAAKMAKLNAAFAELEKEFAKQ